MPRVKAGTGTKRIRRRQRRADLAFSCRHDPSIRIDRCRHPRIRSRQQPPPILDRPHLCLLQVLLPCATVTVPSVIRNVHQNLRSLQRSLSYFVGKNRFIADKHPKPLPPRVQWHSRRASLKLSHFFGQSSGKGKHLRKRQIFTERHEMHFVVASNPLTLRTDQRGGIENLRASSARAFFAVVHGGVHSGVHGRRDANRSRHHPSSRLPPQLTHRIPKQ